MKGCGLRLCGPYVLTNPGNPQHATNIRKTLSETNELQDEFGMLNRETERRRDSGLHWTTENWRGFLLSSS